jgi:hypothetical protein
LAEFTKHRRVIGHLRIGGICLANSLYSIEIGASDVTNTSANFPNYKNPPEWLKETEETLQAFTTLPAGWDSYGAKSIDAHVVDAAIELLHRIVQYNTLKPAVVPTNRSGIQIEWHTRGVDLEIEITPHGEIRLFYENLQENTEEEFALGLDLKPLADLIAKVSPSR